MNNIPIVKLQVEGMRHEIAKALTDYENEFNEDLKRAIDNVCTPNNIELMMDAVVRRELTAIIEEEVTNALRYGDGRKAIHMAISETWKGIARNIEGKLKKLTPKKTKASPNLKQDLYNP
jgi:hypothetical protein